MPGGQYFPLPYAPSMPAVMRVSSSLSFGSDGAASVSESFSSFIFRASSSGSFRPSKRVDFFAYATVAAIERAFAWAARVSVSSVM